MGARSRVATLLLLLGFAGRPALASGDPHEGIAQPGEAAIGAITHAERSPYRGAGTRYDFLPLYLYEGESAYLRSHSVGLKLLPSDPWRMEVFLRRRLEGSPVDDVPESLVGMARREPGIDAGVSLQWEGRWGNLFAEYLRDASKASHGTEVRLGYEAPFWRGRWWMRPQATLALRDEKLNDYYYGVRADEASAGRPAYAAGSGVVPGFALHAMYQLTPRWRLFAGATVARLPSSVRASPIVDTSTLRALELGAMYDVSPQQAATWSGGPPLIVRAFYGASSGCDVMKIATLQCTSIHDEDKTGIAGFEVGQRFVERLNDWPLDIAGFVGLIRHRQAGFQEDFSQINAYLKVYYYGFPWDEHVRTRIGWGVGLSYAERVPLAEQRDQDVRGRVTSKLLNTFDPTIDVSLGDLLGVRRLRETFVGLGVSHRSGIFGRSRLLGSVSGGSNYIYGYIETSF
jgi:MipA family protein